jgi:hypothetical protein
MRCCAGWARPRRSTEPPRRSRQAGCGKSSCQRTAGEPGTAPLQGRRLRQSHVWRLICRASASMVRRTLGRSQVVRQRILIPPFEGSSPSAPARIYTKKSLCCDLSPGARVGFSCRMPYRKFRFVFNALHFLPKTPCDMTATWSGLEDSPFVLRPLSARPCLQ